MDLFKAMESFVKTVKMGSFSQAADHAGVSRAVVSKHIQELESHLGTRLLHRTTRRLSLTEAGREYHGFCSRLLDEIGEQRNALQNLQTTPRGSIKILAPKSFGNIQLSPAIAEFSARYPDIKVFLFLADDPMNGHHLVDGGLDLAIRLSPIENSSIVTRKIGSLRWLLCSSKGYLSEHGAPQQPDDLLQHNCLLHLRTSPDRIWSLAGPKGHFNVAVNGSFAANSSLALRSGVLRGLGIALLPAYCISEDLTQGRLIEVLPEYVIPSRPIFVIYPHKRYLPAKVRLLIDFLIEQFSKTGWDRAHWAEGVG